MSVIGAAAESPTAKSTEPSVCTGCPEAHKCRAAWSAPHQGPFSAVGLSLGSVLAFLLPITTAIIAAASVHAHQTDPPSVLWDIIAAAFGMFLGAAIAMLVMPLIKKHFPKQSHHRNP